MNLLDKCRIGWRILGHGRLRSAYYTLAETRRDRQRVAAEADAAFRYVVDESARYAAMPQAATTGRHLEAAIAWLLRAQDASRDGGFSLGYFPLRRETRAHGPTPGWMPSYPETTGYIIPTLLDRARRGDAAELRERALRAADWEIDVQMESGAVQGGPVCERARQTPAVFNTGQVIFGWLAAHAETGERRYLDAARRAGEFLLGSMDERGEYVRNLSGFAAAGHQTYNVRCSWALYDLSRATGDERFRQAAVKNVQSVVTGRTLSNGWVTENDLSDPERPLVHTIAYTMQGVLEVGIAEGRADIIDAVERGAIEIARRIEEDGFLAGCWFRDWRPAATWCCLTGSAQLAIILHRLAPLRPAANHAQAAARLIEFCSRCQRLDSPLDGVRGGLAGSNPILGAYMRGGYPNWATKFLADALMRAEDAERGAAGRYAYLAG